MCSKRATVYRHIWAASWQKQLSDCEPSEDSDQPGHPPSLNRAFAVRMEKDWVLNYPLGAQRRLWSDWADAQADLSLRWAHNHIVGFVMRRLICFLLLLSSVHKNAKPSPPADPKRKPFPNRAYFAIVQPLFYIAFHTWLLDRYVVLEYIYILVQCSNRSARKMSIFQEI